MGLSLWLKARAHCAALRLWPLPLDGAQLGACSLMGRHAPDLGERRVVAEPGAGLTHDRAGQLVQESTHLTLGPCRLDARDHVPGSSRAPRCGRSDELLPSGAMLRRFLRVVAVTHRRPLHGPQGLCSAMRRRSSKLPAKPMHKGRLMRRARERPNAKAPPDMATGEGLSAPWSSPVSVSPERDASSCLKRVKEGFTPHASA